MALKVAPEAIDPPEAPPPSPRAFNDGERGDLTPSAPDMGDISSAKGQPGVPAPDNLAFNMEVGEQEKTIHDANGGMSKLCSHRS